VLGKPARIAKHGRLSLVAGISIGRSRRQRFDGLRLQRGAERTAGGIELARHSPVDLAADARENRRSRGDRGHPALRKDGLRAVDDSCRTGADLDDPPGIHDGDAMERSRDDRPYSGPHQP